MNSYSCSAEYSWLATKWEILRGSLPGSISWLREGIGEVALDRENIAAITRQKEVSLYFSTFAYKLSLSDISRLFRGDLLWAGLCRPGAILTLTVVRF